MFKCNNKLFNLRAEGIVSQTFNPRINQVVSRVLTFTPLF